MGQERLPLQMDRFLRGILPSERLMAMGGISIPMVNTISENGKMMLLMDTEYLCM